jgi:hypothetical protein
LRRRDASAALARSTRDRWPFLCAAAVVLGGSYAVMSWLGYWAGGAALVAGTLALARTGLVTLAVTSVVAPLALWLLFARLLATPLP